jgi:hypothetical protein
VSSDLLIVVAAMKRQHTLIDDGGSELSRSSQCCRLLLLLPRLPRLLLPLGRCSCCPPSSAGTSVAIFSTTMRTKSAQSRVPVA